MMRAPEGAPSITKAVIADTGASGVPIAAADGAASTIFDNDRCLTWFDAGGTKNSDERFHIRVLLSRCREQIRAPVPHGCRPKSNHPIEAQLRRLI
jgi:hypothetical protein